MQEIILESADFNDAITRMSRQIFDDNKNIKNLAVIGIHGKGVVLAKRIIDKIVKLAKDDLLKIPFGTLDITLYRDDIYKRGADIPLIKETAIPFEINEKNIILVDDVLYTGRTVRAALDVLMDFGRPRSIKLAVLVDRGHRELPIEANFTGIKYPTKQLVKVDYDKNIVVKI
ncbi:MAG: bifunctional pyr operon transcriptional regulator/uracil phosphoribosyltransferase PyrR [Elusimicrobiota bacterium]|jgi:pyrimidine operon attenuation protein/uracil phosphoribosyltransferase|nr:bifunctional pyr operon transcriptional regulator/uracil phosphoribosyltransferase PyrR [Elusimicrobiota bacterium]